MVGSNGRSLHHLQRQAERSRSEFTDTVETLRSKVSQTADDFRDRISPDSIKAEVSDYFRTRGEQLLEQARENPLQATAIGVGLAYPLFRIMRSIPAPILMVGAGLFLMGSSSGQQATRKINKAARDLSDEVGKRAEDLRGNLHDARDFAADQLATAKGAAAAGLDTLRDRASDMGASLSDRVSDIKDRASTLAGTVAGGLKANGDSSAAAFDNGLYASRDMGADGAANLRDAASAATDYAADAARTARDNALEASRRASAAFGQSFQQHPLIIGGIGLAIGALIASALPRSDIENGLVGEAADDMRLKAANLASQGYGAVKDIAAAVYDDVETRARQEGLTPDRLKQTADDMSRRIGKVAEAAGDAISPMAKDNMQKNNDAA